MCAERIDGNVQTVVVFHHPFLACGLVLLHKDASHKQLTTSVAHHSNHRPMSSLESIATDVDSSISLASSQNSRNVKTRSSFPSAPHPAADSVFFRNDTPQAKFHRHLVTNVSLVNLENPHHQLAFPSQSILARLSCKRIAVPDPKTMHMQALDDCA